MWAIIAALLGGALVTAALAPFEHAWLAPLAPATLFLLLRRASAKQAWWRSWAFGIGLFGSGASWVFVSIHEHSATPLPVAVTLTLLFVLGLGLLIALPGWLWRRWFAGRFAALSFIGFWVLTEWLRSWLLTGFPWLFLGYAALDSPLAPWLPLGGVWLGSLLLAAAGIALVKLFQGPRLPQRLGLALLLLLVALGGTLLPRQWTVAEGPPLPVALVQANIPQAQKWAPQQRAQILQQYMQLTAGADGAELVIWPETAIPALFNTAAPQLAPLLDQLDSAQRSLISGLPFAQRDSSLPGGYRYHNSLAVLSGGLGVYHKQRLVPFGEYVPLENWLRGLIDFFNLPMSSFSPPGQAQDNLQLNGHRIAASICYEIAYPELIRQSSQEADLLLTVSNDTWFGRSIAPDQHLQIARMRALENGRWLLRGTNNGITAMIAPDGSIRAQAPRYQAAVLAGSVQGMSGLTPYQRWGATPVLGLAALCLLLGLIPARPERIYRLKPMR